MVQDLLLAPSTPRRHRHRQRVVAEVANQGFRALNVPSPGAPAPSPRSPSTGAATRLRRHLVTGNPDARRRSCVTSGDGQAATVGAALAQRSLPASSTTPAPASPRPRHLPVTAAKASFPGGARTVTVPRAPSGTASVALTLGTRAGAATDLVRPARAASSASHLRRERRGKPRGPAPHPGDRGHQPARRPGLAGALPCRSSSPMPSATPSATRASPSAVVRGGGPRERRLHRDPRHRQRWRAFVLFTAGRHPGINPSS